MVKEHRSYVCTVNGQNATMLGPQYTYLPFLTFALGTRSSLPSPLVLEPLLSSHLSLSLLVNSTPVKRVENEMGTASR